MYQPYRNISKSAKEHGDIMASTNRSRFITQYFQARNHIINKHHNNEMEYKERIILIL